MGLSEAQNGSPSDVYIRTAEAARILRVSPKTISRWAKQGKLPHVVTLGGHRRFPATAIRELAGQLDRHLTVS
ncbi:MAG: helix-turn-helix domain-containing protein [Actinomycetota bacterium]|nr:helix-turn-helix domain-containing protein [Actinomycetota bacterium]